jgi:hypothetical protein
MTVFLEIQMTNAFQQYQALFSTNLSSQNFEKMCHVTILHRRQRALLKTKPV